MRSNERYYRWTEATIVCVSWTVCVARLLFALLSKYQSLECIQYKQHSSLDHSDDRQLLEGTMRCDTVAPSFGSLAINDPFRQMAAVSLCLPFL